MNKDYLHFYTKISCSGLSAVSIQVYRALLHYANRETWSCFPSVRTLMKDTGLSERTIRKHLKLLVQDGWILKMERVRSNNGRTSNMYFFN